MFVYVIGAEPGPYKIGYARDPAIRLKELRTGNPHRIEVASSFPMDDLAAARRVEAKSHRSLAAKRLAGEWFDVCFEEAIRTVQSCILTVDDPEPELPRIMISPAQIRAARALIGWKQADLSTASGVSEISIKNIERGATDPRSKTLGAIQDALRVAGVVFLEPGDTRDGGPGVRLTR